MDAADRGRLMYKLADRVEQISELALRNRSTAANDKDYVAIEGVMAGCALRRLGGQNRRQDRSPRRFPDVHAAVGGVVGQIIPCSPPMLAWKWGPALACGNTIVMKTAEQTPLSAMRMAELAVEVGFPPGVINLLAGYGETTGHAMVVHPDIDKIAFTGHVDTAKLIQKNASATLKRMTFELGGKSPNVIFADANLDQAVEGAFHAIYFHCGQCCTAGSRLFVGAPIQKEFVKKLAERAAVRRIGDPLARAPTRARRFRRSSWTRSGLHQVRPEPGRELIVAAIALAAKLFRFANDLRREGHMDIAKDEIRPVLAYCRSIRWTNDRAGERDLIRAGGGRVDAGHQQGAHIRTPSEGGHSLGELLSRGGYEHAVRRLQDVGPGPRKRRSGTGALHGDEDGDGEVELMFRRSRRNAMALRRKRRAVYGQNHNRRTSR